MSYKIHHCEYLPKSGVSIFCSDELAERETRYGCFVSLMRRMKKSLSPIINWQILEILCGKLKSKYNAARTVVSD